MIAIFRRGRFAFAVMVLSAVLGACGDDPVDVVVFEVIEELTFAASTGVVLADMQMLTSGVYIQDITVGTGAVVEVGSVATITYQGWLASGTAFDAGTLPFNIGFGTTGRAIEGFEEGVLGMLVGGTRLIVIPPALAYGSRAIGAIPAGSVLVFQVTMDSLS